MNMSTIYIKKISLLIAFMLLFIPVQSFAASGDLNSDGKVDVTDLGILLSNWGASGSADINKDGKVDVVDLGILLSNWGSGTTPPPPPTGNSTAPNLKVAFIGDSGAGSGFRSVLQLIKNEGADMVMHQGDFAYQSSDTSNWEKAVNDVLGSNFPYFGSVGNHDSSWSSSYAPKLKSIADRVGATCTGKYGENSVCKYQGLHMILSGGGQTGSESGNASYIKNELAKDNSVWSICSWHHNQREMQVGGKGSSVGWGPYEECRKGGAIIATGHEHSYQRTKTLSNTQSQTVDTSCKDNPSTPQVDVCVSNGATFVFVAGTGGKSLRDQERCFPTSYPYGCKGEWASIYTDPQQNGKIGALFIEFNVDGNPNKAKGYFKDVNGKVIDRFEVTRK